MGVTTMNGSFYAKKLFAKYGRRFAAISKSNDGISTVVIYEIKTIKKEPPIVKLKIVEFNEFSKQLYVSDDRDEENWLEPFELADSIDEGIFLPLSGISEKSSEETQLIIAGVRKLSLKVSEYEKLLDDLEAFNEKSESLRKELIEAFSDVIDAVFK